MDLITLIIYLGYVMIFAGCIIFPVTLAHLYSEWQKMRRTFRSNSI